MIINPNFVNPELHITNYPTTASSIQDAYQLLSAGFISSITSSLVTVAASVYLNMPQNDSIVRHIPNIFLGNAIKRVKVATLAAISLNISTRVNAALFNHIATKVEQDDYITILTTAICATSTHQLYQNLYIISKTRPNLLLRKLFSFYHPDLKFMGLIAETHAFALGFAFGYVASQFKDLLLEKLRPVLQD